MWTKRKKTFTYKIINPKGPLQLPSRDNVTIMLASYPDIHIHMFLFVLNLVIWCGFFSSADVQ